MRKLNKPALKAIMLSEIERLKEAGYEPLQGCDAGQANSDYFMVMVRHEKDTRRIKIVCPSFLRGALGFDVVGGISY